jgi:hypothetical protein
LLLFVSVQVKAVEAAGDFKGFVLGDDVSEYWGLVSDLLRLKLTVDRWSTNAEEEQWEHLANKPVPRMDTGRGKELAREINKLLGIICEWRVHNKA